MNYAILLAGGTGRRITSTKVPKQFVRAGGKMMVTYALEPLLQSKHVDRMSNVIQYAFADNSGGTVIDRDFTSYETLLPEEIETICLRAKYNHCLKSESYDTEVFTT
jgi:hypothetical protein